MVGLAELQIIITYDNLEIRLIYLAEGTTSYESLFLTIFPNQIIAQQFDREGQLIKAL